MAARIRPQRHMPLIQIGGRTVQTPVDRWPLWWSTSRMRAARHCRPRLMGWTAMAYRYSWSPSSRSGPGERSQELCGTGLLRWQLAESLFDVGDRRESRLLHRLIGELDVELVLQRKHHVHRGV